MNYSLPPTLHNLFLLKWTECNELYISAKKAKAVLFKATNKSISLRGGGGIMLGSLKIEIVSETNTLETFYLKTCPGMIRQTRLFQNYLR